MRIDVILAARMRNGTLLGLRCLTADDALKDDENEGRDMSYCTFHDE